MTFQTPAGMSRRHFMSHLAGSSAAAATALSFGHSLRTHAADLKKNHKAAILLWMSGGPSTMDIWDLKPGAPTGGPFKQISTAGDVQICEHMPQVAKVMDKLAIVRSMSTREADHMRGRYYMHTGYVPNPNIEHPSYGVARADRSTAGPRNPAVRLGRRRQRRPGLPGHVVGSVRRQQQRPGP
jgi:hypothetical protein